jgi:HD-like signal output (HDOD) protein
MSSVLAATTAVDDFLAKHQTIKAMPDNTARILRLCSDVECNSNELLRIISQDAALAGQILRSANSSFYSQQSKVTRLDRAVAVMGLKAVKEVSLSTSLGSMCKPMRYGAYDSRDLWDHSVGVAILAREIAVRSKKLDSEEAFLAGMLHDLALLLAAQSEPVKATSLFKTADSATGPFTDVERQVWAFTHCELGERLAQMWGFPQSLSSVIRWHHQPDQAPEEDRLLCAHMRVSDTLCCQAKTGFPITCRSQQITDEDLETIHLPREEADALAAKLPQLLRLYLS